ncbi:MULTISPECIES: DNA-methyltransferase [unclassified Corallococcus]|uniref:DNA-methyltransferase n=1 Tax=unclassified Corallococcus TaxID=2685029 RepID=UPI001A8C8AC2|nr:MULTISPECIES: site-specific DNA-methyltransferase [unclassified Corallococcus]MBN9687152.1 site-specific DNA-methyltransferase [Corallococcus sp. NCSPR001]WAS89021.1 site-specific DNA-methyltransferase [Corallococcus sp. NCRR]
MSCPRPAIDDVLSGRADWALIHGRAEDVLPRLPRRAVAHVLTDPPYSPAVHSLQRRMKLGSGSKNSATGTHRVAFAPLGFDALTPELRRLCGVHLSRVARRWLLVKCDAEGQAAWQAELERAGARHVRVGVWHKLGAQPQLSGDRPAVGHEAFEVAHVRGERLRWNGGGLHAVWTHPIATGQRIHTTQTPVSLWLELVTQFTEPGELILDPFAGSGSLGVACLRLGRRYLGVEMQAHYAEAARGWLAAEAQGLSLSAARAGQMGLFAGAVP